MKRVLLFGIVSFAITALACSSNPSTPAAGNSNSSNSVTAVETQAGNAAAPTPMTVATVPIAPEVPGKASQLGDRRKIVDTNGPIPEPQRIPASENSEMTTTMAKNGDFVETRYFKSDPMLVKVERTWIAAGNSVLKITLKNGKVVTTSGSSVSDLPTATVANLLALAGVKTVKGDTGGK